MPSTWGPTPRSPRKSCASRGWQLKRKPQDVGQTAYPCNISPLLRRRPKEEPLLVNKDRVSLNGLRSEAVTQTHIWKEHKVSVHLFALHRSPFCRSKRCNVERLPQTTSGETYGEKTSKTNHSLHTRIPRIGLYDGDDSTVSNQYQSIEWAFLRCFRFECALLQPFYCLQNVCHFNSGNLILPLTKSTGSLSNL